MIGIIWALVVLFVISVLAYQRASLIIWTISLALLILFGIRFNGITTSLIIISILFLALFIPLNLKPIRRRFISKPLFEFYLKVMPTMSRTEREAISAGTVSWEGDLFRGNPNWQKLLSFPPAKLTPEEQAFLDGPVDILCGMVDDWDVTHNRTDLSPETWDYIKKQGFWGLIIPKRYGGKEFSAFAHSQVLTKLSGRSVTLGSTVAVPNSLGPAELLLHYGTEEQKNYYLPRLARGEEIPCFALTSPEAGSDAGSMTDHGIVCWEEFDNKKTLGIRLNWEKRYITLAPIATVIGLAFKLYDPDHLLGNKEDIGITCALIPRHVKGVSIGRRHFPLNAAFQNGPIYGKNVFIPLEWIIGGPAQAGKGWIMLMECLASGRAISLPASGIGGAKVLSYAAGAYARIRKQFKVPIGRFEGIQEPLARIGGYTYLMDATRTFAASMIDMGEKPAIASAIVKYHLTQLGRELACDAMDIHGGKAICLGPKNYIGRGYQASPIAITVEGANILTRNLIIFGQGAIRCHPYILPELTAAHNKNKEEGLNQFDHNVMKHIGFAISNTIRTLILGLISSLIVKAPAGKTKRYFQYATRFSSALAMLTDVSMLTLGSHLKRKESISARLGDILSYLYLVSATLKKYREEGEPDEDFPLVEYACDYCFENIQRRFDELITNFPNPWIAYLMKIIIFPLGQHFTQPKDKLKTQIAHLLMAPTETRQRLADNVFITPVKENVLADMQDALIKTIASEPIEKMIKSAYKEGHITGYTLLEQAQSALEKQIITVEQFDIFIQADEARKKVIAVDDFSLADLVRTRTQEGEAYSMYTDLNGTNG